MKRGIEIGGRGIGPGEPAFLVAELSANHGGSLEHAEQVIREAKACGADAVKLQTYTADTITIDSDREPFRIPDGSPWAGKTLHELYQEAHTPWEWHPRLKAVAQELGLIFFSTPFDHTAVDFLESLDVPAYKIASFELIDLPLVDRAARTGKPLIMSTGMASDDEIREAVETAFSAGNRSVILLKCTSAYPAPPEEMNLRKMEQLARSYSLPAGLSDHTLGSAVAVAAVALGACLVEKHFCLSRDEGGPDSGFSMEPDEFQRMVKDIRTAEAAVRESGKKSRSPAEEENLVFRRSLFVVRDVARGELFTNGNVRSIRPGHGLSPKHLGRVIGRRASCDLCRGTPLEWGHVTGE